MSAGRGTWGWAFVLASGVFVAQVILFLAVLVPTGLIETDWGGPTFLLPVAAAGLFARTLPRRLALEAALLLAVGAYLLYGLGGGLEKGVDGVRALMTAIGVGLGIFLPLALIGRPERDLDLTRLVALRDVEVGMGFGLLFDLGLLIWLFLVSELLLPIHGWKVVAAGAPAALALGWLLTSFRVLSRRVAVVVFLMRPVMLMLAALGTGGRTGEPFPWSLLVGMDLVWGSCMLLTLGLVGARNRPRPGSPDDSR